MKEGERKERAERIVKQFLVDGSEHQVNVVDSCRKTVLDNVDQGNIEQDTFLLAEEKIFGLLVSDSYLRFQSDDSFVDIPPIKPEIFEGVQKGKLAGVYTALGDEEITVPSLDHCFHNGVLLLHLAVQNHHVRLVDDLLQIGANPNVQTASMEYAIHLAIRKKHLDCVSLLLKHGAHVDAQDGEGLHKHKQTNTHNVYLILFPFLPSSEKLPFIMLLHVELSLVFVFFLMPVPTPLSSTMSNVLLRTIRRIERSSLFFHEKKTNKQTNKNLKFCSYYLGVDQ